MPKDGGTCRRHLLDFHRMKIKKEHGVHRNGLPQASSRTLAIGLHVARPSGATRPRGRSALVVLRRDSIRRKRLLPTE